MFFLIEKCKVCGERRGISMDSSGNRIRYYKGSNLNQFVKECDKIPRTLIVIESES